MARTVKDWYRDCRNVSGVEQRVKDYQALIRELEDCIRTAENAYIYMDFISEDLSKMSSYPEDESEGSLIVEFESLSGTLKQQYTAAYDEIVDYIEKLKDKKNQAETQLVYYKARSEYENTLNRDLKPYEYNVS